ncbi:MAG: ABC transporter ATP-binding protein [Planctomycetota bacterium]
MSDPAAGPAIELRQLTKVYKAKEGDVRAVDALDLQVERGEIFGLLGPNGAGKTSMVEICEGLEEPTSGEVRILGRTWGEDSQGIRERIGVSLQETKFFEKLSVRELLELFSSFYSKPMPLPELLELVGLEEKARARYQNLSGGQCQRLAVACALIGYPELLFLDEPTTGLDPQSRIRLWEVIRSFRERGGTLLLTTHYMEEAAALCDRLMIIDHGRCIALGSPRQLIAELGAGHVVSLEAVGIGERLQAEELSALPSVRDSTSLGDELNLTVEEPHVALPAILALLREKDIELEGLSTRHTSLDDVFVHHTGRHLRDEETSG